VFYESGKECPPNESHKRSSRNNILETLIFDNQKFLVKKKSTNLLIGVFPSPFVIGLCTPKFKKSHYEFGYTEFGLAH
jgi:hypothetical protein